MFTRTPEVTDAEDAVYRAEAAQAQAQFFRQIGRREQQSATKERDFARAAGRRKEGTAKESEATRVTAEAAQLLVASLTTCRTFYNNDTMMRQLVEEGVKGGVVDFSVTGLSAVGCRILGEHLLAAISAADSAAADSADADSAEVDSAEVDSGKVDDSAEARRDGSTPSVVAPSVVAPSVVAPSVVAPRKENVKQRRRSVSIILDGNGHIGTAGTLEIMHAIGRFPKNWTVQLLSLRSCQLQPDSAAVVASRASEKKCHAIDLRDNVAISRDVAISVSEGVQLMHPEAVLTFDV